MKRSSESGSRVIRLPDKKFIVATGRTCAAGLLVAASAPLLHLDAWWPGVFLTYPPRLLGLGCSLLIAFVAGFAHRRGQALVCVVAAITFLSTADWGSSGYADGATEGPGEFRLLSFNVLDDEIAAEDLASLCRQENIDVICLQEVRPKKRPEFEQRLPDYRFFYNEPEPPKEHPLDKAGLCLIAIRNRLIEPDSRPEVSAGITGYRTFGVRVRLGGHWTWIVNVHTTKVIWRSRAEPLQAITMARYKARRHMRERDRLDDWLADRAVGPIVIAGDFNAPSGSYGLRIAGFESAHGACGRGLHLTFPAALPMIGIDHVLGNSGIRFRDYRLAWRDYSDHAAQITAFDPVRRDR